MKRMTTSKPLVMLLTVALIAVFMIPCPVRADESAADGVASPGQTESVLQPERVVDEADVMEGSRPADAAGASDIVGDEEVVEAGLASDQVVQAQETQPAAQASPTAITVRPVSPDSLTSLGDAVYCLPTDGAGATVDLPAVSVEPEGAADTVTWASSDETVASVSDGLLLHAPGMAVLTATSELDGTVSAHARIYVVGGSPTTVDVDGSGWLVEAFDGLDLAAEVRALDQALTEALGEGETVQFVGTLSYSVPTDEGAASSGPAGADLYFPVPDGVTGDTVTIVFYPDGGTGIEVAAPLAFDEAGLLLGAHVEIAFDGDGFTLNGVPAATVCGQYEVIGSVDAKVLLAEELDAARAELAELTVLDDAELGEAADGTRYVTRDQFDQISNLLDAIEAQLKIRASEEDVEVFRQQVRELRHDLDEMPMTVQVDRGALEEELAAADAVRAEVTVSEHGRDVLHGGTWAASADAAAFDEAIADARAVYDAEDATSDEIAAARDALAEARRVFEAACSVAEVSLEALESELDAAAKADDGVVTVARALDAAPGARWVTKEAANSLAAAVDAAKAVAARELSALTQDTVDAATSELMRATTAYRESIATKPAIEDIKIERAEENVGRDIVHMLPGNPLALKPVFTPAESAVAVTWSSSNTSVATVDADGKVTAVGDGAATITATTRAFDGVESKTAVFTVVPIGCGARWTYENTAAGIVVEGVPSGVDVTADVVTGSQGFPVGKLGRDDRAVAGVFVTLATGSEHTVVGIPIEGMSARIPLGTNAYDGKKVEATLYGDDGYTYTYTATANGGTIYLTIPAGGYVETIARAALLAETPDKQGDPAKPSDEARPSDDDVRERLAQTGDESAAAIAALGGAGVLAAVSGIALIRRRKIS